MGSLNETIKRIALDVMNKQMPVGVYFGTVASVTPLKIDVEQKMILEEQQLVLTSAVQDFDVEMTVEHVTEDKSGGSGEDSFALHNHDYTGTKSFNVKLGLVSGEKVILLRVQGGQKFIVLDRVR